MSKVTMLTTLRKILAGESVTVSAFASTTSASEEQVRDFFLALSEEGIVRRVTKNRYVYTTDQLSETEARRMQELAHSHGIGGHTEEKTVEISGELVEDREFETTKPLGEIFSH